MSPTGRCVGGLALFLIGAAGGGIAVHNWKTSSTLPAEGNTGPRRSLEATILVPLHDNQGRRFTEEEWQAAVGVLVHAFGGVTLGEPQEGWWVNGRREVQREQVRPVVVSFAPERLEEFRRLVRQIGKRLGQEAMYVRFKEPHVELIAVFAPDASTQR